MLFELSIIPVGGDSHISIELAEVMKIVDGSGLPYQLTPSGTSIEGEWDDVLPLIQQCHKAVRERSSHVITTIKIEDEEGQQDKLTMNVRSIEEKVGKKLSRSAV
ncbi:MAG: MTH1187 family thiamine-binding protein [Desulfobacterales bacterium]